MKVRTVHSFAIFVLTMSRVFSLLAKSCSPQAKPAKTVRETKGSATALPAPAAYFFFGRF